ncbi:DUF4123 domain-containing protein [Luteimonas sp. MJ250]|uniref:DUF4123 domain-containing protein n=1 Tax=Luteimonas sp. MJ250 TaxID=3129236 RepID=UPI0031BBB0AD
MTASVASNRIPRGTLAIGEEAAELSEQIVRHAAVAGARFCYLLLDPTLRSPAELLGATAREYGIELSPASIAIGRNQAGRDTQPLLIQMNLDRYVDTELCRMSAQIAVDDWNYDSLRQGNGHRVGGWLFSSAEMPVLARHLARQAVHRRPSGGQAWVRFHDSRVMDMLCNIYDAPQREQLRGDITAWLWLSRWRTLETLRRHKGNYADGAEMAGPLSLRQWADVDNIGPLNRLWLRAVCAGTDVDRSALAEMSTVLARAREYGFNDPEDLVEFGWRALRVHRDFDSHPEIRRIIAGRGQGDFFGYLVADLGEAQWNVIAEEMRHRH